MCRRRRNRFKKIPRGVGGRPSRLVFRWRPSRASEPWYRSHARRHRFRWDGGRPSRFVPSCSEACTRQVTAWSRIAGHHRKGNWRDTPKEFFGTEVAEGVIIARHDCTTHGCMSSGARTRVGSPSERWAGPQARRTFVRKTWSARQ